ncbi:MAG: MXAN_5187 C-terminal domain-containing protein [Thermoanaerobaculia bacterium]
MNPTKNSRVPPGTGANRIQPGTGGNALRGMRPGVVQAPAKPSATEQLDRLAEGIDRFKVEFERFLAGATLVPPEESRTRLVRDLRELRNANLRSSAEQFRLASLEARFNSYSELFNRRLRDKEEGRSRRGSRSAAAGSESRFDVAAGIVVTDRLEASAVDALYQSLSQRAGGAGSAPAMELEKFRGYLSQQIESIRLKTGCEAVQFRVATEDGKIKLKAKPVHK